MHCTLAGGRGQAREESGQTTRLQLKLDPPPIAGQEMWMLLSRHELSAEENDRFVGLRVAAHWGTGAEAVTGTRVDDAVSKSDRSPEPVLWSSS